MKLIKLLKEIQIKGLATPEEVFEKWNKIWEDQGNDISNHPLAYSKLQKDWEEACSIQRDKNTHIYNGLDFLKSIPIGKVNEYYKEIKNMK
jgi:hypothetical protein